MPNQRILPGYEEQVLGNDNGQPNKLKRRKSSWAKKLVITLIVFVVVIGGLIGAALMVGDFLCRDNLGVSLWTLFDVMGDLKKDDSDKIITNAYGDDDIAGFYSNINGNLFLKESAETKNLIDGLMSSIIANGGASISESLQNDVLALFSYDNIDLDRLEQYTGWQDGADGAQYLMPYTNRQFAAFFDSMIFSAIDQIMGDELPYRIKLSDFSQIDQFIIAKGIDIDDYYNPVDNHVYMSMTASINLNTLVEKLFEGMDFDISGFMWLFNWLMPKSIYFSITFDMNNAAYAPVYELNRLGHEKCNYKAVGADEAVEMTKQDRVFEVVNAIVNNIGDRSDFEVRNTMDDLMTKMESFIVEDEDAAFSLGNYIIFDSVKKTSAGNEFKIDLLGSFMSMAGSGLNLKSSDVIVLMQAVMCPDTVSILAAAPGAPVYAETGGGQSEITTSAFNMYDDTKPGGGGWDNIDDDLKNSFIEQYGDEFLLQLAEEYGITITELDEYDELVYLYTLDDLYGALGLGDETEKSKELYKEIEDKVKELKEDDKTPTIKITDEMLCALMFSKLDGSDADLAEYGITFRKLAIESKEESDGEIHSYAKMYCTFDFNSLVGDDSMMAALIDNMLGGKNMLLEIIVDITISDDVMFEKTSSSIIINGLDGNDFNGLTTKHVTDILEKISSFNFDNLFIELDNLSDDAIDSIASSPLVGIKFIDSATV